MLKSVATFASLVALVIVGSVAAEAATQIKADGADKQPPPGAGDWPCVQHKVEILTPIQFWDGPPIEGLTGWNDDPALQKLIPVLTSRRVTLNDAGKAIEDYAKSVSDPAERDKKLTLLFAGFLSQINTDRKLVVNGLEKFQQRQRLRAAELEREGTEISKLKEKVSGDQTPQDLTKAQELYDWNVRVFQERQQTIPLACEIPVLIEQRAYEVARHIRSQMTG